MAYGSSAAGSDWQEWKVRDVASGKDLADDLKWSKFSGASWTTDNKGFYYSRYDEPNEKTKLEDANYFQKLYYHRARHEAIRRHVDLRTQRSKGMGLCGRRSAKTDAI